MKHQANQYTRPWLAILLASSWLASCGVANEMTTSRPHPALTSGAPRLANGDRRAAPDSAASPAARPQAAAPAPPAAPLPASPSAPLPVASPAPVVARPANMRTQSGRIIDEAGQPLVGATVLLKGTSHGASTDASGGYSFQVPLGLNTFVFGYSGYQDEVAQSRDGQPLTVTLLPTPGRATASQEATPPRAPKLRR